MVSERFDFEALDLSASKSLKLQPKPNGRAKNWFSPTKNFLLPLRIEMHMINPKARRILKVMFIGMLIISSAASCIQIGSEHLKNNRIIACEGDPSDTIIVAQERQRTRVFFDVLKKITFVVPSIHHAYFPLRQLNSFEVQSLLMNVYQRNVFYVFAFSTVP
jgi:hypothetical protein